MKKTILLNFIFTLCLISCSSDDNNDEGQDSLLSNTEWVYSYGVAIHAPETQFPPKIDVILSYIYANYPPIAPTTGVIVDNVELNTVDSTLIDCIDESKLKFSTEQCIYSNEIISVWKKQKLKAKYKRVKIPNQEGKNKDGIICRILSDGIYLIDESIPVDNPERQRILIKLENNEYKEELSREIISEYEQKESKETRATIFTFDRVENEISLTNGTIQWLGTLDKGNTTISLEQIAPESKSIGRFEKK